MVQQLNVFVAPKVHVGEAITYRFLEINSVSEVLFSFVIII